MHRPITFKEAVSNLTNLYRFIDIRSIVCRQDIDKSEWFCIFSKIRLTDDDNEQIKRLHNNHLQNLGIEKNEQARIRFLFESRDIKDVNSIIDEIFRNQLTVNGITFGLQAGANKGIEGIEVQKYDYYSTMEERKGYLQWFIFLPNSGNRSTYSILTDFGITVEEIGLELEFLNTFFDISSTEWDKNTNNLAFLMPIYIKRSEIFKVEKEKTLVKYLIHKELLTVCTARKIIHYKDNVKILRLDLRDLTEVQGSSHIVPIMLPIDNTQFSKTEFEITHNSMGKLFGDSLGQAEKIAIKDQNHFDEASIHDIISDRENERIERKSAFLFDNKNSTRNKQLEKSISKAIQGFANSYDGGILFIGVDNNGKIIGLTNDYSLVLNHNSDGFELELRNSVEKYLKDKVANELIKICFPIIEGKEICRINISPSSKPIVLYENGNEEFYVRVGNSTRPYTPTEFIEYIKRRFPKFYVQN